MVNNQQIIPKLGLIGTLSASSLLGIVIMAEPGKAQVGASCPRIFYREPFTYQVAAPVGCPLTEFQQQNPDVGGSYPPGARDPQIPIAPASVPNPNLPLGAGYPEVPGASTSYPNPNLPSDLGTTGPAPLPEERSQAIANVALVDNRVDVMMTNDTGTAVTYQVVGHTQQRLLRANETVSIQNLPVPATITAVRSDDGLLNFEVTGSSSGMVEVSLMSEAELDDTQGVMLIQADGQIFAN